jgi:hypothetical protein
MRRLLVAALVMLIALPVAAVGWLTARYRPKASLEKPIDVERDIRRLTMERDSLSGLVLEALQHSDLVATRPAGNVLIGVPTPFVNALVRDVVIGWFHDVELRLPEIKVHKAGEVKARLSILGRRRVGTYDLDVTLNDVRGRLQPGVPDLDFGGDIIKVSLPVRLARGTGNATVALKWDSKGMASPVCGDLAAVRTVTGSVLPAVYVVKGRIVLSALNGIVTADPDFPELAMRLFVEPSKESLTILDQLLATKGGVCGIAVRKAKVGDRIVQLVGRGFNVKIPQKFFRAIRLPIAVETSVAMQDRDVSLAVRPSGLSVTRTTVWLGADVAIAKPK